MCYMCDVYDGYSVMLIPRCVSVQCLLSQQLAPFCDAEQQTCSIVGFLLIWTLCYLWSAQQTRRHQHIYMGLLSMSGAHNLGWEGCSWDFIWHLSRGLVSFSLSYLTPVFGVVHCQIDCEAKSVSKELNREECIECCAEMSQTFWHRCCYFQGVWPNLVT